MNAFAKGRIDTMVVMVILAVIGVAIYAGASVYRTRANDATPPPLPQHIASESDAAQHLRLTLDPNQFVGDVKKAYQIAEHDPALLAQLHCYCGCDKTDGHKNLLDCYRDTHGAHCAICTGEAIEAETLADQGMPVEKIRDALRDRFANGE